MQSTVSVSKGCFVFKNGLKTSKPSKSQHIKTVKHLPTKLSSLLTNEYKSQRWYQAYKRIWTHINDSHEKLKTRGYTQTIDYLQNFVRSSYRGASDERLDMNMPTTALLTGINQPDHMQLFRTFAERIRSADRSHVCIIQSLDCPNMKSAIETMVSGLLEDSASHRQADGDCRGSEDYEDMIDKAELDMEERHMRRSQYTMAVLKAWYSRKYSNRSPSAKPILTVIIPDFENFARDILQQFILLLSHNCKSLPIVLVLGVATDLATLHRTLSFADTSRLKLQVTQSQPSTHTLSQILDEILLTPTCLFTLSPKVFTLLTDIFLYFDLSINSFMQGFKYCAMEHFNQGNLHAFCSDYESAPSIIAELTAVELDTIRRLASVRHYIESLSDCRQIIGLLTDDEFLRNALQSMIGGVHIYLTMFHWSMRVLLSLVQDLPRNALGKQLRDLYARCAGSRIVDTAEFQSSWDLLSFMSKDELLDRLQKTHAEMLVYKEKYCGAGRDYVGQRCAEMIGKMSGKLRLQIHAIANAGTKASREHLQPVADTNAQTFNSTTKVQSRLELQAKLLEISKKPKVANPFTTSVSTALDFLRTEVLAAHLVPFALGPPLLELFVFSDLPAVRSHIMGAPRAALHTGLNNPQCYLQCNCCAIENAGQMVGTMPDLSIVYKLHLESGKMINLFDWMQAFRSVVDPISNANETDEESQQPIDPQIQARFTRAVAELQFLGFIKGSKRKTDHVARLTW